LHGSWLHLGGNMLFLWVFGNNVEDHLGHLRYLVFYLAAGAVAALAHFALDVDSTIPVVGASGAIAGVMGAYAVWFPWARVRTIFFFLFIPFFYEIPAAALLALWFLSQFFIVPGSGVAWMAHVGGFVFGALVALAVRADPRFRYRLWVHEYATLTGAWDNRSGPGAGPPRR
ncbi:MAG: rhomboid family intramembrane serine protease, partial [Actinomyces sp.]